MDEKAFITSKLKYLLAGKINPPLVYCIEVLASFNPGDMEKGSPFEILINDIFHELNSHNLNNSDGEVRECRVMRS